MSEERPFADLPRGQYAAIVADPPWSYVCFSEKGMASSGKEEQGKLSWSTPILEPVPGDYDRATLANADIF